MELIAKERKEIGKQAKKVREDKFLPGVVFGKKLDSLPISVQLIPFIKVFNEAGETSLVDLELDGKKHKVLIKEVQLNPVTGVPVHVSFYKPDLTQKTTVSVPVEVVGGDKNDLVKSGAALVLTLLSEIEVEALPADLPSKFVVDVSGITEIGDGIEVKSLNYDRSKVEIVGAEEDELVVKLDYAEMREEETEEVSEAEALEKIEATEETAKEEEEESSREKDKAKEKPETPEKK